MEKDPEKTIFDAKLLIKEPLQVMQSHQVISWFRVSCCDSTVCKFAVFDYANYVMWCNSSCSDHNNTADYWGIAIKTVFS